MKRVAFFDFDGTLLVRDAGMICARESVRRGLVPVHMVAAFVGCYLLYKLGLGSREAMHMVGFRCYRGRTLDELRSETAALSASLLRHHLSPAMKAAVERHARDGDALVVLTASAHFFAEPLGRDLGFHEVHGTRLVYDASGRATGDVDGGILDGARKLEVAREIARARGTDLRSCAFYTDEIADLPLLEAVGEPVVVGRGKGLADVVRARAWPWIAHDGRALTPLAEGGRLGASTSGE